MVLWVEDTLPSTKKSQNKMTDQESLPRLMSVDEEPNNNQQDVSTRLCPAEQYYEDNNQDKRVLVVFCIGLKQPSGEDLFDSANPGWTSQPVEIRKPLRQDHYIAEVKRRADLFDIQPRPKPGQWNLDKIQSWLHSQPIINDACVDFISRELKQTTQQFEDALATKEAEKLPGSGAWLGNAPWLRLLHCILEDDIRVNYLNRDRVLSRMELDAGSSPNQPPSVYQQIAERWGSTSFNPVTCRSTCHEDFTNPIDVGYSAVVLDGNYSIPSSETIHHRLTDMRSKLVRIIKNWEISGQGEGSTARGDMSQNGNADEGGDTTTNREAVELNSFDLGRLENRSAYAMHSRRNFLNHPTYGRVGSWILYYWEQMDKFHLLGCTINVLSTDVSASDAQSAPLVVTIPTNRKRSARSSTDSVGTMSEMAEDMSAIKEVGDGLKNMVSASKRINQHTTLTSRRRELENRIFELLKSIRSNRVDHHRCNDANEKEMIQRFILEDENELGERRLELAAVSASLLDFNM